MKRSIVTLLILHLFYVVFVPDIPYITGAPGHSAFNSVVSGTEAMIDRYAFIDPDNVGLQGQSWGGYQIT